MIVLTIFTLYSASYSVKIFPLPESHLPLYILFFFTSKSISLVVLITMLLLNSFWCVFAAPSIWFHIYGNLICFRQLITHHRCISKLLYIKYVLIRTILCAFNVKNKERYILNIPCDNFCYQQCVFVSIPATNQSVRLKHREGNRLNVKCWYLRNVTSERLKCPTSMSMIKLEAKS